MVLRFFRDGLGFPGISPIIFIPFYIQDEKLRTKLRWETTDRQTDEMQKDAESHEWEEEWSPFFAVFTTGGLIKLPWMAFILSSSLDCSYSILVPFLSLYLLYVRIYARVDFVLSLSEANQTFSKVCLSVCLSVWPWLFCVVILLREKARRSYVTGMLY